MASHQYTAKEIAQMRDKCYGIAHALIDRYGDYFGIENSEAVKFRVWLELTEQVLQSYLIAGVTLKDLGKDETYND